MNGVLAKVQLSAILWLLLAASEVFAQNAPVQVPTATPLTVRLGGHVPMKKGEPLRGTLTYPVYADNELVIPTGSVLYGSVIALSPDRTRRTRARLSGDFTPFHIPMVHFDRLVLPDGTVEHIFTNNATGGALVLHLSAAPLASRSIVSGTISQLKDQAKSIVSMVTAPGRKDRLVQLLYKQLPYHPERIKAGTTWTVVLERPLELEPYKLPAEAKANPTATRMASHRLHPNVLPQKRTHESGESVWHLDAYLEQSISSANEKRGNTFEAVVADPVFNADHTLAVPEGAVLVGTITRAKPARSFGRAGKLRFDFRELKLPGSLPQNVEGTLAAADLSKSQQLQINLEGGVRQKPKDRVIVPLALSLLAGRAFDEDGNAAGNAAVASNGFGIIDRVVGIAAGSRDLAAGIGFYAAGLSIYERWLAHGKNIVFPKDTRIEVTTVPARNPLPLAGMRSGASGQP